MEKLIEKYFGNNFKTYDEDSDVLLRRLCFDYIYNNEGHAPSWMFVFTMEEDNDDILEYVKSNSRLLTKNDLEILLEFEEAGYGEEDINMFYYNPTFVYSEFIEDFHYNKLYKISSTSNIAKFVFEILTWYKWDFKNIELLINTYNNNHIGLLTNLCKIGASSTQMINNLLGKLWKHKNKLNGTLVEELHEIRKNNKDVFVYLYISIILDVNELDHNLLKKLNSKRHYLYTFNKGAINKLLEILPTDFLYLLKYVNVHINAIDSKETLHTLIKVNNEGVLLDVPNHIVSLADMPVHVREKDNLMNILIEDETLLIDIHNKIPIYELSDVRKFILEDLKLDWKDFDKLTAPEPKELL